MCGCLSGTLPQIPQQNVFLGLPLELMPEEAALLVEKRAGYIVDDRAAHRDGLRAMQEADKLAFLEKRRVAAELEALEHLRVAEERKEKFLKDKKDKKGKGKGKAVEEHEETRAVEPTADTITDSVTNTEDTAGSITDSVTTDSAASTPTAALTPSPSASAEEDSALFVPPVPTPIASASSELLLSTTTDTVSGAPFHLPTPTTSIIPRPNANSYALYKHLHAAGYFLSPGLRFGCQFMAYPGDPLRFHSHFLTRGLAWDEELDLIDLVAGGRLGTGVKKAWMFGGAPVGDDGEEGETRVFCVEWGGF